MALHKIIRIVVLILALIGIVLLATILSGNNGTISLYMNIAYLILGLAIFFTLLFSFTQLFTNKASLKKTLISVGAFILVILISYVLASGEDVYKQGELVITESGSKWVDTGLRTFYFLVIIAIGLMFISGVKKLVKN
jgi:hypothetical protein